VEKSGRNILNNLLLSLRREEEFFPKLSSTAFRVLPSSSFMTASDCSAFEEKNWPLADRSLHVRDR
jgi:hypothetical protein